MTTVLDVARHAGVSSATVSRVLNDRATVHPELRQRVRAAIDALGFSPNPMARGLRRGHSNTIALLVGDIAQTHFAELTTRLQAALEAGGYDLMLFDLGHSAARLDAFLARAPSMRLRGVVLALSDTVAAATRRRLAALDATGLQVVAIGPDLSRDGVASIVHDERASARRSVEALLADGHRRIAYVGRLKGSAVGTDRYRGYRDALAAVGAFDPSLVWDDAFRYAAGHRAVLRALDAGLRFDAIQAGSDEMAVGALAACSERGVRVPREVAIVGFGGIQLGAFLRPALSTLSSQPAAAAAHLRAILDAGPRPGEARCVRLERTLVRRGSS